MAMELSRDPYIYQVSSLPRDADEMQAREWEGRHRNGRLLRTGLVLDSRCSSIFLMDAQLGVSKVVVPVAAGTARRDPAPCLRTRAGDHRHEEH